MSVFVCGSRRSEYVSTHVYLHSHAHIKTVSTAIW